MKITLFVGVAYLEKKRKLFNVRNTERGRRERERERGVRERDRERKREREREKER